MKTATDTKTMLKWLLNVIIPLAIAFIPTTESFTSSIKWFLVITIFVIVLFATNNIPLLAASILLPILYMVLLQIPMESVFSPWTTTTPWLALGGSLLTLALQKTGLLKRIAYRCILLFGGKFRGLLFGMMFVGVVISVVMSDVAAKAILLGALALGICNALEFELGGRASSAIGLAAIAACLGPSYLYYTGSSSTIVIMSIAESVGVAIPSWGEYFFHMAPPQMIYIILSVLIIDFFFKPDQAIDAKQFIEAELQKMGRMSKEEIKLIVICLLVVAGIATNSIHGYPTSHFFILAAVVLMSPGIRILTPEDGKKANYGAILFITACMSIGVVSSSLGVGEFVATTVYPYIAGSTTRMFAGLWGMGFLVNFALTPAAAVSMLTEPLVNMANLAGINPIPVLYAFNHALEQVLFPYEYAAPLLIYGYGMISMKNFVKYNAMRALLSLVCIFAIFIPYWSLIGIM